MSDSLKMKISKLTKSPLSPSIYTLKTVRREAKASRLRKPSAHKDLSGLYVTESSLNASALHLKLSVLKQGRHSVRHSQKDMQSEDLVLSDNEKH